MWLAMEHQKECNKVELTDSPFCCRCEKGNGTLKHILCHCLVMAFKRRQLPGSFLYKHYNIYPKNTAEDPTL